MYQSSITVDGNIPGSSTSFDDRYFFSFRIISPAVPFPAFLFYIQPLPFATPIVFLLRFLSPVPEKLNLFSYHVDQAQLTEMLLLLCIISVFVCRCLARAQFVISDIVLKLNSTFISQTFCLLGQFFC